jgi:hypothetical protein
MLDFINSNGKFERNIVILLDNHNIGPDSAHKVFKVVGGGLLYNTWEFSGHLPSLSLYHKIIDRRNGTI